MFFRSNHSNKQWEGQSCAARPRVSLGHSVYRAELFVRRAPRPTLHQQATPTRAASDTSLAARRSHPRTAPAYCEIAPPSS